MTHPNWIDDTDAALAEAAERYTRERCGFAQRSQWTAAERRCHPAVWRDLAEMGWLSVSSPEAEGGLGIRPGSVCLLAEAQGRALMNEPVLSSQLAGLLLAQLGDVAQRQRWLPGLLAGETRVAVHLADAGLRWQQGALHGRAEVVLDADIADHLLVLATDAGGGVPTLLWLPANSPRLQRQVYPLLDGRGAATLQFEGCGATPLAAGPQATAAALQQARDLAALASACDAFGAADAALAMTLDYLKTRRQFGVPLGSYQALQHRAVEMHVQRTECRAVLDEAIRGLQQPASQAALAVHAAKAFVGDTTRRLVQEAVQLHGGIGITEEYALSHLLRRVRVDEQLHGSAEQHFQAFAALTAEPETELA